MRFKIEVDDEPTREGLFWQPTTRRTVEFSAEQLDDVLDELELFLKGCGFQLAGLAVEVEDEVFDGDYLDEDLSESSENGGTCSSFCKNKLAQYDRRYSFDPIETDFGVNPAPKMKANRKGS